MQNLDKSYIKTFNTLKQKIKTAQIKAAVAVNSELIMLYWEIGKTILERQEKEGWGSKVIDRLSSDLLKSFPDMKGLSGRNLLHMRKFAETYPDLAIVKQLVSQLPWGHNILLLNKFDKNEERIWYAKKAIENGWSRNILTIQIESNLYQRQNSETKTDNFSITLLSLKSDLVREILKDPYKFDFLSLGKEAHEREIEKELIKHITYFLLELGKGFAFVGQQYKIEVSDKDFYIDLLFYHINLKCYIVIELKAGEFKPEYAGKLNFYLSAVDDKIKDENDNPSIGIILCKTKDKLTAEYALRSLTAPISINEFRLMDSIPENLKTSLPTIEELEQEFSDIEKEN